MNKTPSIHNYSTDRMNRPSPAITPLHGFDDDLEAVHETFVPDPPVTRHAAIWNDIQLLGLLEDSRRRPRSNQRKRTTSFDLDAIDEEDGEQTYQDQLSGESSAEWDGNPNLTTLSADYQDPDWSAGTQFNVTVPSYVENDETFHETTSSLESDDTLVSPEREKRVLSGLEEILVSPIPEKTGKHQNFSVTSDNAGTPLNSTEHCENKNAHYTEHIMADVIKGHRTAIREAVLICEDDISIADPQLVTSDYLEAIVKTVIAAKTKLQQAIAYLEEHDPHNYEANYKKHAVLAKQQMLEFIKSTMLYLKQQTDAAAAALAESGVNRNRIGEATNRIKIDSVNCHKEKIAGDIESLVGELQALVAVDPKTDFQYHGLHERYVNLAKRTDSLQKDARSLYKDAVDCGLEDAAKMLDTRIHRLREVNAEADMKIHETKELFGIQGNAATKLVDIKPPEFKGETNEKLDYFSFKAEFDKYISTKNVSTQEILRVLQQTCLQGRAQDICRDLETLDEVWVRMKQSYGNPKIIFNNKVEEIKKLGQCRGSHANKRDWGIIVVSKLRNLEKVCSQHKILNDLYYSPMIEEIRRSLPQKPHELFCKRLEEIDEFGNVSKDVYYKELVMFLDKFVSSETFEMSLETPEPTKAKVEHNPSKPRLKEKSYVTSTEANTNNTDPQTTGSGAKAPRNNKSSKPLTNTPSTPPTTPIPTLCLHCNNKHTHLFYCEVFMTSSVKERYVMSGKSQSCWRCLRLDSQIDFNNLMPWFKTHWNDCRTRFPCKNGNCAEKKASRQLHLTMCEWHIKKNKDLEPEFIKSLDQAELPPSGARFFFNSALYTGIDGEDEHSSYPNLDKEGCIILPDVSEPPIYMMQQICIGSGRSLLMFYDSGCMGATLSNRAYSLLETENMRPGPTVLNVAGAEEITVEYGEERFRLPIHGSNTKATITGLRLDQITNKFPLWELQEAWEELNTAYRATNPTGADLPKTGPTIGGKTVDVMLGMRYNKYFPVPLFNLPSGLAVYKAQFSGENGFQGVLGGVHKSWRKALQTAQTLGYQAFFTAEYKAYSMECSTLTFMERLSAESPELETTDISTPDGDAEVKCLFKHCSKHETELGWIIPSNWSLDYTIYNVRESDKCYQDVENLGTEQEYRCVTCRNCSRCRNGDELEKVSLREELEQSMIETSVSLDVVNKRLEAKLPFTEDPVEKLKPNRYIAEKILSSQLRNLEKNPEMLDDVLRSHSKLLDKGHVISVSSLSEDESTRMNSTPGTGYIIPWRTVYKEGSLSTPCRMVFDASSRTPGGESLNAILAKGQNKLAKILHLLIRFRRREYALTADVSMAYNGVKLAPEHYKYQQYLWKDGLISTNPTVTMVVRTLIYGVRSAGGQTIAGFDKLSQYVLQNETGYKDGAEVLRDDSYMDDIMTSTHSPEVSKKVAADLEHVLSLGSMGVKEFTFSGVKPLEKVSADGENVGIIGYLWNPLDDTIKLDIKKLYLGKPKRGKLPDPVVGDVGAALKPKFTRRTLVGKAAGVYDPLGLVTPISAKFKLDLHDLCFRKLDWDDSVPEHLLPLWVENLETMQKLKKITFRRTIIPSDAQNTDVELLVSVDASQDIAISAVHARILRRDGSYHIQLITAKSKLVSSSTIPRAELKAAVTGSILGHITKQNLGEQYKSTIFVTDSTICLFWIHQDERPMHIAIRNSVIEIRRFSLPEEWFHVETQDNIADLGTRPATVNEIGESSAWQTGKSWMLLPRDQLPIRSAEQVTLSGEEKKLAAAELKSPDLAGYSLSNLKSEVSMRYAFSKYIVDPCIRSWPSSVRILAYVLRFVNKMKNIKLKLSSKDDLQPNPPKVGTVVPEFVRIVPPPSAEEICEAEKYFFRKATLEVKQFSKAKEYRDFTMMKDKILYYTGRIVDGQEVLSVGSTMLDLDPLTFVKPVVDRYSPVAYSIMIYSHESLVTHRSSTTTLRESRNIGYVLRGRDLAVQVREACVFCKRFKKRLLAAEMGKIHETRLTVAPAFYYTQVDLMGPFDAICEHNHRSKVSVWGVVFKDPASGAVAVHVMAKYDTGAFILAYTRFSSNHGHPAKLFIDEGGQLIKACKEMEFGVTDLISTLNTRYSVGIEFSTCPVGGHNVHGMVERSIKELKKIFVSVYRGLRLSITGYETAFQWTANELNCLPICLGSRYQNLDNLDLITPARLLFGRNNRRSASGICRIASPSKMIQEMEKVFDSWWKVWKEERIIDFIPQPRRWLEQGYEPQPGDLVVFLKHESDVTLGEPVWRLGRVLNTERSKDGTVRTVIIEYRNASESTFRTTRRSVRRVAVLHKEGELELVETLNLAAKNSNVNYIQNLKHETSSMKPKS